MKNKEEKDYKPVSCNLYDRLEAFASLGQQVQMRYRSETGEELEQQVRIVDLETKDKQEFLITKSGLRLRLDQILSITEG